MSSQEKANQANMELAKYNWEQTKEMWNMNNEYNKPSAQMSRYLEAGLNPNLIYGSGSASAGNSTSSPAPQLPRVEPLTDGSFLGSAAAHAVNTYNNQRVVNADVKQKESVAKYNEEAAQAKHEESILTTLKQIGERYQNDKNEFERPFLARMYEAKAKEFVERARGLEQNNEWFDVTYDARYKAIVTTTENLVRDGKIKTAQEQYTLEECKGIAANIAYLKTRREALEYELKTNPDPERVKTLRAEMLENDATLKQINANIAKKTENSETFRIIWNNFTAPINTYSNYVGANASALSAGAKFF